MTLEGDLQYGGRGQAERCKAEGVRQRNMTEGSKARPTALFPLFSKLIRFGSALWREAPFPMAGVGCGLVLTQSASPTTAPPRNRVSPDRAFPNRAKKGGQAKIADSTPRLRASPRDGTQITFSVRPRFLPRHGPRQRAAAHLSVEPRLIALSAQPRRGVRTHGIAGARVGAGGQPSTSAVATPAQSRGIGIIACEINPTRRRRQFHSLRIGGCAPAEAGLFRMRHSSLLCLG